MDTQKRCDGVSRRDIIRIGGLSALGLGLGDFFRLRRAGAAETPSVARAKSCILIWLDGGPSHLETFDLKPDAPQEVRGPFDAIATSVPGIQISEYLPGLAKIADENMGVRYRPSARALTRPPVEPS